MEEGLVLIHNGQAGGIGTSWAGGRGGNASSWSGTGYGGAGGGCTVLFANGLGRKW